MSMYTVNKSTRDAHLYVKACSMLPPSPRCGSLPSMFATTLTIGAPKRKAPASGAVSSRQSHYGLSNDSSAALGLVALSRVAQVRDDDILQPAAQTPVGAAGGSYTCGGAPWFWRARWARGGTDGFNGYLHDQQWCALVSVVCAGRVQWVRA